MEKNYCAMLELQDLVLIEFSWSEIPAWKMSLDGKLRFLPCSPFHSYSSKSLHFIPHPFFRLVSALAISYINIQATLLWKIGFFGGFFYNPPNSIKKIQNVWALCTHSSVQISSIKYYYNISISLCFQQSFTSIPLKMLHFFWSMKNNIKRSVHDSFICWRMIMMMRAKVESIWNSRMSSIVLSSYKLNVAFLLQTNWNDTLCYILAASSALLCISPPYTVLVPPAFLHNLSHFFPFTHCEQDLFQK